MRGTRLGEARSQEAPRPCAPQCRSGAPLFPRFTPTPLTLSVIQARQSAGALPGPSGTSKLTPSLRRPDPPRLPAASALLQDTCSEIRVSGREIAAVEQRPRTAPSSQSVGAPVRCGECPNWMELGSGLPGADRSRVNPWYGRILHAPEQLSLCSRAHEPHLLSLHTATTEACAPEACALRREPHA